EVEAEANPCTYCQFLVKTIEFKFGAWSGVIKSPHVTDISKNCSFQKTNYIPSYFQVCLNKDLSGLFKAIVDWAICSPIIIPCGRVWSIRSGAQASRPPTPV